MLHYWLLLDFFGGPVAAPTKGAVRVSVAARTGVTLSAALRAGASIDAAARKTTLDTPAAGASVGATDRTLLEVDAT